MVRDSILKSIKRLAIPFGVVSTASLMFNLNTAKAETLGKILWERGNVGNGIFTKKAIEERGGVFGEFRQLFENMDQISEYIIKALDWFNNLPISIPKYSADLLTLIFNFLSKIALTTPLFIFNNPFLKNTSVTFALISITIVTILTIYESFMQMFKQEHTDFKTIAKRWAIVASVTGFMPFAFEKGFELLNTFSGAIANIGNVNGGNAHGFITGKKMGFFDTLIIILFDLTAISLLVPFALQSGKRWFDLLCLAAISPLALSCAIFDRHKHHYNRWLGEVKSLSLVQLVHAVFILLMGVLIFATQSITGGFFVMATKLLLVLGALYRLCNPPKIVTQLANGNGDDIFDVYDSYKKTYHNVKDVVTGKTFRPTNFIGDMIAKHKENKMKQKYGVRHLDVDKIQSDLRKKHGRRYVKDLL